MDFRWLNRRLSPDVELCGDLDFLIASPSRSGGAATAFRCKRAHNERRYPASYDAHALRDHSAGRKMAIRRCRECSANSGSTSKPRAIPPTRACHGPGNMGPCLRRDDFGGCGSTGIPPEGVRHSRSSRLVSLPVGARPRENPVPAGVGQVLLLVCQLPFPSRSHSFLLGRVTCVEDRL